MSDDIQIDYGYLTQDALRHVIRQVLEMTEALGDTPGDHHFYIEFTTTFDGVSIPDHLKESFPERMTIVLQHKFDDLEVNDESFSVTLQFNGIPDRLIIPFDAITSFVDPSTDFALRFETVIPANTEDDKEQEVTSPQDAEHAEIDIKPAPKSKQSKDTPKGDADIVSLDAFRKK